MLTLLNGNIYTRIAPNKYEKDSILDLAIVSNNILKCVESFKIDPNIQSRSKVRFEGTVENKSCLTL